MDENIKATPVPKQPLFHKIYSSKQLAILIGILLLLVSGSFSLGVQYQTNVDNKNYPVPTQTLLLPTPQPNPTHVLDDITTAPSDLPRVKIDPSFLASLKQNGNVLIIVSTSPPSNLLDQDDQSKAYKMSSDKILADIANSIDSKDYELYGRWDSTGQFAVKVYTERALSVISSHPFVKSLQEDIPSAPASSQ